MTADEIIDQIKALPPPERAKVVDRLRDLESPASERTMDPKTFERSANQVFDRHAELMHRLSQ
jgi:hypothetical protein